MVSYHPVAKFTEAEEWIDVSYDRIASSFLSTYQTTWTRSHANSLSMRKPSLGHQGWFDPWHDKTHTLVQVLWLGWISRSPNCGSLCLARPCILVNHLAEFLFACSQDTSYHPSSLGCLSCRAHRFLSLRVSLQTAQWYHAPSCNIGACGWQDLVWCTRPRCQGMDSWWLEECHDANRHLLVSVAINTRLCNVGHQPKQLDDCPATRGAATCVSSRWQSLDHARL